MRIHCENLSPFQQLLNIRTRDFALQSVPINGATWHIPSLGQNPYFLTKGAPHLPLITRSLTIPDTGNVVLRVAVEAFEDYPATPIAPSKGPLPRTINPATIPYTFGTAYQEDFWPTEIATADTPYILRNRRGVTIRICPFRYYPHEQRLRVYTRLQVEVVTRGDVGLNTLTRSAQHTPSDKRFEPIYASRFLNYSPPELSTRYTPLADTNDYMLIIAADSLTEAVQPLADWKNQRGIQTIVVPLSSIGSTTTQIKNYIQSYYDTNGLTYLLIAGDGEDVPSPVASTGSSDPTYSKLAGSDNYPDIFVGRFSGSTTQQIATMVQRTIAYERDATTNDTWYNNATGIASDEGSGPSDIEHMNAIRSNLLTHGYTVIDQIYDPGATVAQVANAVHAGRGLFNYVGHGDVQEWVTTTFANADVNSLTNTTRWPFIFDVACVNGQFTGTTCFAEAWIRSEHNSEPAGALAIYSSTINQDWEPPMTAQNEFNTLLTTSDLHAYGALCFNASMKMMDDWGTDGVNMFNTWTVFGDPSAMVRTDTPDSMNVSHGFNGNTCTVHVHGVEGALAALSISNTLLGSAYTDTNGDAAIQVSSWPNAPFLLTVSAFNKVTYTTTVETVSAQLDISPSAISNTVPQETCQFVSLVISNSGEAGSSLTYTAQICPVYHTSRSRCIQSEETPATREMTGSEVLITPSSYGIASNATFSITLTNRSPDSEWVQQISISFPGDCNVTSAQNITGLDGGLLVYDNTTGTNATVTWTTSSGDEIIEGGYGSIQVQISPSAPTNLFLNWSVTGDGWGEAPHTVTGIVELTALAPPAPSLSLTTPVGGEEWMIGSTQQITWSSINYTQNVDLLYSTNGGAFWSSISSNQTDTGSFDWMVTGGQSDNCLIAIQSPDGSISSTNSTAFSVYDAIDWLILDRTSGTVTSQAAQTIGITLSATNMTAGTYSAELIINSSVGTTNIPVSMTVSNSAGWTILANAGTNGSILPFGSINLADGSSTSFVISAATGYYIASVTTNGTSETGTAGLLSFTSHWDHVAASGSVTATFANIQTDTATNDTPVPWLRAFYPNQPNLQALEQQAELDTDDDGLFGWQEFIVQSDPTNPASAFYSAFSTDSSFGIDILQWQAVTGRTYSVYHSTNLIEGFQLLASGITVDANGNCAFTNTTTEPNTYYSLTVEK